jgi:hypothetical protein
MLAFSHNQPYRLTFAEAAGGIAAVIGHYGPQCSLDDIANGASRESVRVLLRNESETPVYFPRVRIAREPEGTMYEVFPLVAGVIIGLLGPRFVSASQRKLVYGALGIVVAAFATIIAGEEWFFLFIDLAFVFGAMALTIYLAETWPRRRTTRTS